MTVADKSYTADAAAVKDNHHECYNRRKRLLPRAMGLINPYLCISLDSCFESELLSPHWNSPRKCSAWHMERLQACFTYR